MRKMFLATLIIATPYFLSAAVTVEVKIGTGMEKFEPTGVADTFSVETDQLIGWCKVIGSEKPMQIIHVWKRDGKRTDYVPLAVKSSWYRTHSRQTVKGKPGQWSLEVQDMDGNVLASKEVIVGASPQK